MTLTERNIGAVRRLLGGSYQTLGSAKPKSSWSC